jgi:hypothetical protein
MDLIVYDVAGGPLLHATAIAIRHSLHYLPIAAAMVMVLWIDRWVCDGQTNWMKCIPFVCPSALSSCVDRQTDEWNTALIEFVCSS